MIAYARRAVAYIPVIALTFFGSWLLYGREIEAKAGSVPLSEATESLTKAPEIEPLIFIAQDRTCVYVEGQLACFCSCAEARTSCEAPPVIYVEPQAITVPGLGTEPRDRLSDVPPTDEGTEIDPSDVLSRTMLGLSIRSEDDPEDDSGDDSGDEKQKCNQGVGNGAEGCDPGNSNHNQPSNDEEGGIPGSPGRQGPREPDGDGDRPDKPDKED